MFGDLIVWYLFLGGSAAGMVSVLAACDLAYACAQRCEQRGAFALAWTHDLSPALLGRGFRTATVALTIGVLCLLADLGRPERFFYVFTLPTASVLTFGSFVLATTLACALFLAAVATLGLSRIPGRVIRAVEVLAVVAGLSTTVYTGVLLSQMESVALWNAALPPLFACSSLSVGVAAVLTCLVPLDEAPARLVSVLARTDTVLIALETLCFAAYVAVTLCGSGSPELAGRFLFGQGRTLLWLGFVMPALAVPGVLEVAFAKTNSTSLLGAALPFLFVGGFFLRYCIVNVPLV